MVHCCQICLAGDAPNSKAHPKFKHVDEMNWGANANQKGNKGKGQKGDKGKGKGKGDKGKKGKKGN